MLPVTPFIVFGVAAFLLLLVVDVGVNDVAVAVRADARVAVFSRAVGLNKNMSKLNIRNSYLPYLGPIFDAFNIFF